jgi:hypothetical protein
MEPEELKRLLGLYGVNLTDYSRYMSGNGITDIDLGDLFGEQESKKKPKKKEPEKASVPEELGMVEVLRIKESIEKYEEGYRPYLIDIRSNVFRPLSDLNQVYSLGDCQFVWLLPKIAEKIAERFDSITKLEKEIDDFTKASYSKISEYEERIQQLLDKGHDLLL